MMKARVKFLKMFRGLPERAKYELIFGAFGSKPRSLMVIASEVRGKTEVGDEILKDLGYKDDSSKKQEKQEAKQNEDVK